MLLILFFEERERERESKIMPQWITVIIISIIYSD